MKTLLTSITTKEQPYRQPINIKETKSQTQKMKETYQNNSKPRTYLLSALDQRGKLFKDFTDMLRKYMMGIQLL